MISSPMRFLHLHHCFGKGMRTFLKSTWTEPTSDQTNFGGWFDSRGANGIGLYAKGGANGYAAKFNGKVQIDVGVGTGTTLPSEMLSVDSFIESKSGGIKFPDGSVQSTAAAPLPRPLISVRK